MSEATAKLMREGATVEVGAFEAQGHRRRRDALSGGVRDALSTYQTDS